MAEQASLSVDMIAMLESSDSGIDQLVLAEIFLIQAVNSYGLYVLIGLMSIEIGAYRLTPWAVAPIKTGTTLVFVWCVISGIRIVGIAEKETVVVVPEVSYVVALIIVKNFWYDYYSFYQKFLTLWL